MKHRIVTKEAFRLVGLKTRVSLVHEGPNPGIEEFERSLDPAVDLVLAGLSDVEPVGPLAITDDLDDPSTEGTDLDYWHAVATTVEAPEGLEQLEVPAGSWVVFETEGPFPHALQRMWADAAAEWFPANPYRWAPGPQLLSVQPDAGGATGRGQLWIPVEPA